MTQAFAEPDTAFLVGAFLFVVAAAYALMRTVRSVHAQRLQDLHNADFFLKEHFACAERIVHDPATPAAVRETLALFSMAVGRRDVARAVARHVLHDAGINENATPSQIKRLKALQDSIKELQDHRIDLVQDFAVAINSGFAAMVLRWPETQNAAVRIMAKRAEPISNIREQSKTFIMSVPERCLEPHVPSAVAA